MIPLYVILGAEGSGRRRVLAELAGASAEDAPGTALLLRHPAEPPEAHEADLLARPDMEARGWHLEGGRLVIEGMDALPGNVSAAFLLGYGRGNPVDLMEALHAFLPGSGFTLARILTVVHSGLLERRPRAEKWTDACIHFSDAVLLGRREEVGNKWETDYLRRLEKARFPCLIERIRKDRVPDPLALLYPEVRRLSHLFDEDEESEADAGEGAVWENLPPITDEEGNIVEEDEPEDEEAESEGEDPYIERMVSGRRAKEIPDIAKILDEDAAARGEPAGPS